MLTFKILDKWQRLLEKDPEATHVGQWVGFNCDGAEDSAFVVHCVEDI